MKNLITAAASLMVLLAFLLQFTHSQVLYGRLLAADQAVNSFREIVKQEGCISPENEKSLRQGLAGILDCGEEEITVDGDRVPLFRGSTVSYEVEAPVKNAVTTAKFWNIDEKLNRFVYRKQGVTASEYIGRMP